MTLSEKMKAEAIKNGLCRLWAEEWKEDTTKEEMVDKFIRGIDFCIIHDFPSVGQMKEYALKEFNDRNVYVDQEVNFKSGECPSMIVLNGDCNASIDVKGGITEIWIRHNSKLRVLVREGGLAMIRALDNANIKVTNWMTGHATIIKYNKNVEVETNGNVLVKDRYGLYENKNIQN